MQYALLLRTLLIFTGLSILITSCNKDNETDADTNTTAKLAKVLTVQSGALAKFGEVMATTGDTIAATNEMAQWIITQEGVKSAYYLEGGIFEVYYTNGLRSSIILVATDANGQHLTRGGGAGNQLNYFKGPTAENAIKIKNNKVLVLNPFLSEFYAGSYNKLPLFDGGDEEFEVDVVNNNDVGLDDVASMGDYGLTILNTHGLRYGFLLFKTVAQSQAPRTEGWTEEEVVDLLAQHGLSAQLFESGQLELSDFGEYSNTTYINIRETVGLTVTERYIRNMNTNMDGSVVFGNHCYSGHTLDGPDSNNMSEAWRSKGVVSYYGYAFNGGFSKAVDNDFCKIREDSLIVNLCQKTDSTGEAHLDGNGNLYFYLAQLNARQAKFVVRGEAVLATPAPPSPPVPFYFYHFHEPNYQYGVCGDTITDSRDGQRYPTVCIGGQVWMAANLNWAGAGLCFEGNNANCDTYGRLYTWAELMDGAAANNLNPSGVRGICPQGWHVPSKAEFEELYNLLGGIYEAGGKMKSTSSLWIPPNLDATNSSGWSGLPGGKYITADAIYRGIRNTGHWWSTTEMTSNPLEYRAYRLDEGDALLYTHNDPPTDRQSCRCVKD